MTLDEAIKHAEEVAEANEWFDKNCLENIRCRECAKENRQLAEWLKELKAFREQTNRPEMETHHLKISPQYFEDVQSGKKNFELRKDDRGYEVGDLIILKEYVNGTCTGRVTGAKQIKYILRDVPEYGLKEGYCILGF